jgi:transcriptional antiterminator
VDIDAIGFKSSAETPTKDPDHVTVQFTMTDGEVRQFTYNLDFKGIRGHILQMPTLREQVRNAVSAKFLFRNSKSSDMLMDDILFFKKEAEEQKSKSNTQLRNTESSTKMYTTKLQQSQESLQSSLISLSSSSRKSQATISRESMNVKRRRRQYTIEDDLDREVLEFFSKNNRELIHKNQSLLDKRNVEQRAILACIRKYGILVPIAPIKGKKDLYLIGSVRFFHALVQG